MKLEQLGTLLKKDQKELVSTLNLTEGQEDVSDELAVQHISNHLREIEISKLSEGKKQGEGMAKRTILSDVEKKIKDKFGVDGSNFDELIESLSTKVTSQPTDEKFKKEIDLWKAKHDDVFNKYNGLLSNVQKLETKTKITSKLQSVIEKIDFPTSKVKDIAINDFIDSYSFEEAESGLYAKKGDKVIIDIENLALNHLKEYGKEKQVQTAKPNVSFAGGFTTGSKTKEELFAELDKAKTAEERAQVVEALKDWERANKN